MDYFKLILVDPDPQLCHALRKSFTPFANTEVVNGYFEQLLHFDCLVSAGNAFGIMDGGIDAAVIRFFGRSLMERVQAQIIDTFGGEQPIGTSMIIPTEHPAHPYLAYTPTMRIPMSIRNTVHVFRAMSAALIAVQRHNANTSQLIHTLACPGLGTATGQMLYTEAARQMALAYHYFLNPPQVLDWKYALERHKAIEGSSD